jgi:hypothetical protein
VFYDVFEIFVEQLTSERQTLFEAVVIMGHEECGMDTATKSWDGDKSVLGAW